MSNKYKFSDELNIRLVRGIEKGYSEYAELRSEKRKQLRVSGAYAWVKGNHIEDQVSRELDDYDIQYNIDKAGYTWEYLKFNNTDEKYLFLIKNANIIRGKSRGNPRIDSLNADNYLAELSKINSKVRNEEFQESEQGTLEFLDLESLPQEEKKDIAKLNEQYERFYILSYSIDRHTRMLLSVDLWMPESQGENKVSMIKIDSLGQYLGNIGSDINITAIHELSMYPAEEE